MLNPSDPPEGSHVGAACRGPSDDEDLPPPPEQSQVDAIHAEIRAVIDHDRSAAAPYFSGI